MINQLVVILLAWTSISGFFANLFGIDLFLSKLNIILQVFFVLIVIKKYVKDIIKTPIKFKVYLIIILFYCYSMYNHMVANVIPEAQGLNELSYIVTRIIFPTFLFYGALALYLRKNIQYTDIILKRFIFISTLFHVLLYILINITIGKSFFLIEAQVSHGITLIVFSYDLVLTTIACLYFLYKHNTTKLFSIVCILINLTLIFVMGKRGPLLSIISVIFIHWLFSKKNLKQILLYILIFVVIYRVAIIYIDEIISILTLINKRLGTAVYDAYYLGDNNGRDFLWLYTEIQIMMNPLWGTYPKIITCPPTEWCFGLHPHNMWLESLISMGLVGTIPLFFFIIYILLTRAHSYLIHDSEYRFFVLLLISELVHGFFSGTLYTNLSWLCLFMLTISPKVSLLKPNTLVEGANQKGKKYK